MTKLTKKRRKEMVSVLLDSMGDWDSGEIYRWAQMQYEEILDKASDRSLIVEYHHNVAGPGEPCDDEKCKYCEENRSERGHRKCQAV